MWSVEASKLFCYPSLSKKKRSVFEEEEFINFFCIWYNDLKTWTLITITLYKYSFYNHNNIVKPTLSSFIVTFYVASLQSILVQHTNQNKREEKNTNKLKDTFVVCWNRVCSYNLTTIHFILQSRLLPTTTTIIIIIYTIIHTMEVVWVKLCAITHS